MSLVTDLSGVVFNQNQSPEGFEVADGFHRYQDFYLPPNYVRGSDGDEKIIPDLTGFQVLMDVTDTNTASIDWLFQVYVLGTGFTTVASGTTEGASSEGNKVWMDIYFDKPLAVPADQVDSLYRLGLKANAGIYSYWFTAPNPFALNFAKAYKSDGTTAIQSGGLDVAFNFRLLGLVADDGIDFLGNNYRSAVVPSNPDDTNRLNGNPNSGWMSEPLPSRFAVANLYFDVRPDGGASYQTPDDGATWILSDNGPVDGGAVIDQILLDPLTPGMYFNLYYSNEGEPGADVDAWDNKLWVHVPQTFHVTKRETHTLSTPIRAKYLKLEFSHLQAQSYNPGDVPQPKAYRKHPKWVLDYFLARVAAQNKLDNSLLPNTISVIYDALDLAYNYYLDDLGTATVTPVGVNESATVSQFLQDRSDFSDQVDQLTLQKINTALAPYQNHISDFAKTDYILGAYSKAVARNQTDYPVEINDDVSFPDVRQLRSESVVFESDFPVMFFYLTCRHKYRKVIAEFSHNRAYFAGVRELAFLRSRFAVANDAGSYQEPTGDFENTAVDDFSDPIFSLPDPLPEPPPVDPGGGGGDGDLFFTF